MGICMHSTYPPGLPLISLLRMSFSCSFPLYFWVTSISLSVGHCFLCLERTSCFSALPCAPHSLRCGSIPPSLGELLRRASVCSAFFPLDFSHALFCTCSIQHDLHSLCGVFPLRRNQFIWHFVFMSLIGRRPVRNCAFMEFSMFVSLSTNSWKTDSCQQSTKEIAQRVLKVPGTVLNSLHQFQGKSSRGKITTSHSFVKRWHLPIFITS